MELNFNKVTYDGDLAEFSEEDLRELISEFETAQESNVAEFEKAAEATDGVDESTIKDFETARSALIADITEAEAFDKVPLTEETLKDEDFSDLQDWKEFVADQESGSESETENEGDFNDFGQESPTNTDDETEDFVEEELGSMRGVIL